MVKKEEMEVIVHTPQQIEDYKKSVKRIESETKKIEKGYLSIVSDVVRIDRDKTFTLDGFNTMAKFCEEKFNMSRQTLHNLKCISVRFADAETLEIRDKYKALSFKQLLALLDLPEAKEALLPDGWEKMGYSKLRDAALDLLGIEGEVEDGEEKKASKKSKKTEKGYRYSCSHDHGTIKDKDLEKCSGDLREVFAEIIRPMLDDALACIKADETLKNAYWKVEITAK